MTEIVEQKTVEAVGVSVGLHADKNARTAAIEAAMVKAIEDAHAEGVTDPDEVRARMLKARDAARG